MRQLGKLYNDHKAFKTEYLRGEHICSQRALNVRQGAAVDVIHRRRDSSN